MRLVALGWRRALALLVIAHGLGYAGLVAWHRSRYGKVDHVAEPDTGNLLDRFLPAPEVIERNHIAINAPAAIAFAAGKEMRLLDSMLVRALIKTREMVLGGTPDQRPHPAGLIQQMQSIGWVVLAERADREIVLGAATMPWHADPVFRSIPSAEFLAFRDPGYVKIAWSLRVEAVDANTCVFHTETRVSTTDADARERFRRYWSFVAPGVELIRVAMLRPLKQEAERRARLDRE